MTYFPDTNLPQLPLPIQPIQIPSPRYLPVNVPFSNFGTTVVTMDRYGNITIKVDQPDAPSGSEGGGR